jgi:hypothetical protein
MPDAPNVKPEIRGVGWSHRDVAISALANRQHGVVSRSQLAELGLTRRAIEHRLETGRLHPLHRGVYAVGHRVLTRDAARMAATLVAEDAVLSHRSAGALWGIHNSDRGRIDVTVPRYLRPRARLDIHQARLPPDEITTHHGIPVTTPARTLLDLAAILDPTRFERAATEAEIRRLTSPTSLDALVARYPRRPGTKAVTQLLRSNAIGKAVTRRELELRFLTFLDKARLPRPSINATLDIPPKPVTVDCLWPAHGLVAELDGFETHGTRIAFEADRTRDRAVMTAGYRTVRITYRQLATDARTLEAQLRALLRTSRG